MKFINISRRNLLKVVTTSSVFVPFKKLFAASSPGTMTRKQKSPRQPLTHNKASDMTFKPNQFDGPYSSLFFPLTISGNARRQKLTPLLVSETMATASEHAPQGQFTAWGIPFEIGKNLVHLNASPVFIPIEPVKAKWIIFLHTSDIEELEMNEHGLHSRPFRGEGKLAEHIADYTIEYGDQTHESIPIKRRYQLGMFQRRWGENCIEAVAHHKPCSVPANHEQESRNWGYSQTRVNTGDGGRWVNWLYAWENPNPDKEITGFQFKPQGGTIVLSAITAGNVSVNPLRWQSRRKAVFALANDMEFDPNLDADGLLSQIQLDLGQIISATPRLLYPKDEWSDAYDNKLPEQSQNEILIEYTAHPEARFYFWDGTTMPVAQLDKQQQTNRLRVVPPAMQRVRLKVVEKNSSKPVAVKLHVHGEAGEYLAPEDRHRLPNPAWFEDYSVDFVHRSLHPCTYIPGETVLKLPRGKVYLEISKGFEIKPLRKVFEITPKTEQITIELEKVLPWREQGWVTADTHVHFLSPGSALMEGAGEGVNVVNLLASQWGELMTNVGDFDGKTTFGSKKAGGDGEYLVRVGTENRQHVLGHISLLGYEGNIITPMTTGGPDESALGDPIEVLLTEWARQCKQQNGLVILPHFPNPRLEHAASIVSGDIDGIEMTSWGDLYSGISPYSLTDWYRYLNCGYFVPAVGGTDKMSATTAVGTVRTYAKIDHEHEFEYDTWKVAVQKGHTFVTYGPLLEFAVDGKTPGTTIKMSASGGTVDITWQVASVTVPMTKVELVVNGEIRESDTVKPDADCGQWSIKIDKSSWLALLVRGHYPDKPEIIAAHSSPVMIQVQDSEFFAAADALTILEQIEGAIAYLDTIGTRAEDAAYKRMRMVLEATHRTLHNRMHQFGMFHEHSPMKHHPEHE